MRNSNLNDSVAKAKKPKKMGRKMKNNKKIKGKKKEKKNLFIFFKVYQAHHLFPCFPVLQLCEERKKETTRKANEEIINEKPRRSFLRSND
jgi:hypothetical protein